MSKGGLRVRNLGFKIFAMKVINWGDYTEKLIKRGEVWVSKELLSKFEESDNEEYRKRGRPYKYPTLLIIFLLIIKYKFKLGYRQLEGFTRCIFGRLGM